MPTIPFGLLTRNFDISESSANFSTTSATFVSITDAGATPLSVTLEVSGNTPVSIFCTTAETNGNSFWGMVLNSTTTFSDMVIRILNNGTGIGDFTFRVSNGNAGSFARERRDPPSVIHLLESPTTGSHTYTIELKISNLFNAAANEIKLVAVEL